MRWDRSLRDKNARGSGLHSAAALHLWLHLGRPLIRALQGPEARDRRRLVRRLLANPGPGCPRCGTSIAQAAVTSAGCPACHLSRLPWESVVRLGNYTPPLSEALIALKYHGEWAWAPVLGGALAQLLQRPALRSNLLLPDGPALVTHVPMHHMRRWTRGFDQAALIAQVLARQCDWPFLPLLRRHRATPPQASLSPSQRWKNVRDAFSLTQPTLLRGCPVVLVDDIRTTGASLRACARLLRRAGAGPITVAVVAVADAPSSGSPAQP